MSCWLCFHQFYPIPSLCFCATLNSIISFQDFHSGPPKSSFRNLLLVHRTPSPLTQSQCSYKVFMEVGSTQTETVNSYRDTSHSASPHRNASPDFNCCMRSDVTSEPFSMALGSKNPWIYYWAIPSGCVSFVNWYQFCNSSPAKLWAPLSLANRKQESMKC